MIINQSSNIKPNHPNRVEYFLHMPSICRCSFQRRFAFHSAVVFPLLSTTSEAKSMAKASTRTLGLSMEPSERPLLNHWRNVEKSPSKMSVYI